MDVKKNYLVFILMYSVPLRHTKGTDIFLISHCPKNFQIFMDKY